MLVCPKVPTAKHRIIYPSLPLGVLSWKLFWDVVSACTDSGGQERWERIWDMAALLKAVSADV